ncbi:OmpA family protein [Vibrio breoganii]
MAEALNKNNNKVVMPVKKSRKSVDEEPHGGAWKLALSDLMVALFCTMLTLWIMAVKEEEDAKALTTILSHGTIVNSGAGIDEIGRNNSISPITLTNLATSNVDAELRRINDTSLIRGTFASQQQLDVLAKKIEEKLDEIDSSGKIDIKVTPEGLKMTIADTDQGSMFHSGRATLTPYYEDLLLELAPMLASIGNSLVITGHTDASRFIGGTRSNWDLSVNRANTARRYLQRGGVPTSKLFQVTGMGMTALLDTENPRSPMNRRIELFVLTPETERQLRRIYHSADVPDDLASEHERQLRVLSGISDSSSERAGDNSYVPF